MKQLTLLALAAALAACHNQNREQAGPAPVPSDSAARARDSAAAVRDSGAVTHQVDPNRTGPPGEPGRPGNATVNVDSLHLDTTKVRVDSTGPGVPPKTSAPQDTLGPRTSDSTSSDSSHTAP